MEIDNDDNQRIDAIDRALLATFQLSDIDYNKIRSFLSAEVFIRMLEQDGFTVERIKDGN